MKKRLLGLLGRITAFKPGGAMLNSILQLKRTAVHFASREVVGHPLAILNYHRVLPRADPFAIDAVAAKDFENQLRVLNNFYHILPLEDAVHRLRRGELPAKAVCLTFDDGYRDNYQFAFDALKQHRTPATIFLTTDFIGGEARLWHDRVLYAFEHTNVPFFSWPDMQLDSISMYDEKERRAAAFAVLEGLKRYAPRERDDHIDVLVEKLDIDNSGAPRLMLSWEEIQEMHQAGISFGAHTRSHPILSTLDDASLEREIVGSIDAIQARLGGAVRTFAYPNGRAGDFDERSKAILKAAGIQVAVTTSFGMNSATQDVYELRRMSPWEVNPHRFAGRLFLQQLLN